MITLAEKLKKDVSVALKSGEKKKVETLRFLLSLLQNEEIKLGKSFNETATLAVLQKEMKRKKEALEMFKKAGRYELTKEQETEIEILARYLPKELSEEEVKKIAQNLIAEEGITDFGKLMAKIMPALKGKASGNLVNKVVRDLLIKNQDPET